jgi:hypothetical protein
MTEGPGAVDADACFVPAGSGVITLQNGTWFVAPCLQGLHGSNTPNSNIRWAT